MKRGFSVIVAADEAGGIGKEGGLPWRLPGDMRHFRRTTTGDGDNAVVMGRRTWASIPPRFRPLKERLNVVMTRRPQALDVPQGVRVAASLDAALAVAADSAQTWVIGGGAVYAEALRHPGLERLVLTRVAGMFGCDTFLPPLPDGLRLVSASAPRAEGGVSYRFEVWLAEGVEMSDEIASAVSGAAAGGPR